MNSHDVTITGYLVVLAAGVTLQLLSRFACGFDRMSFDGAQYLIRHRCVHAQAAEAHTPVLGAIDVSSAAHVANRCARIIHIQHSPTAPTTEQTGQ